jgi:uncharacterized iron-regulated membrane protein
VSRSNSKKPRQTAKKIFGFIHLWFGLAVGLVVVIVALTGAIYAFQPELSKATQPWLSVKAENKPYLPVSQLRDIAAKQLPGKKPTRMIFKSKESALVVHFIAKKPVRYYYAVYLNPYTGQVLKTMDINDDFFRIILNGHMYLWLPQEIGHQVVGWSVVIFLLMIISGIVLWWPRNKAARKNSFKVKWNASPKRLNYDLHNVFGFYASWVLIFIVITGLVWSFDWVGNLEYKLFALTSKNKPKLPTPASVKADVTDSQNPLDKIFNNVTAAYPNTDRFQVNLPQADTASVMMRVYPDKGTYYRMDYLYFNQYTAEAIKPGKHWNSYEEANAGEKASRMNYDIHTGAIAGLPGRILVFFAGLIAASLPITGFYIWWGKKKKAKKPVRKAQRTVQQPETTIQPVLTTNAQQ